MPKQGPFDERAALGDLERFRADIERYRKQREAVSSDFEEFVRSFPSPVDVFPSEESNRGAGSPGARETERLRAGAAGDSVVRESETPVRPAESTPPIPPHVPPVLTAPMAAAGSTAAPSLFADDVDRPKRSKTPLVAAVLVLLIGSAAGAWFYGARVQPQTSTSAVSEQTRPAAPAVPPPAPAAVAPPVESEITTVRSVWIRVIADGERVLERELPANTRVPFEADKTIVIRTGDAGAVRLSIRGEDQGVLGRDGEVVTRSFAVPAKPSSR